MSGVQGSVSIHYHYLQAAYDLRIAEIENARKIEREIMPIAV